MELLIKAIPDLGTPLLRYKSIPGIKSPLKFHSSAASTKPSNRPKQAHGAWAEPRGSRPCKKLLQCLKVGVLKGVATEIPLQPHPTLLYGSIPVVVQENVCQMEVILVTCTVQTVVCKGHQISSALTPFPHMMCAIWCRVLLQCIVGPRGLNFHSPVWGESISSTMCPLRGEEFLLSPCLFLAVAITNTWASWIRTTLRTPV